MESRKETFVPHTLTRRAPASTALERDTANRVAVIENLPLPDKKSLSRFFSQDHDTQPRWAKYLSPIWWEEDIDIKLRQLAQRLNNEKLGFRFPETLAEYAKILEITDVSIFGIIIALRWEKRLTLEAPPNPPRKPRRAITKDTLVIGHRAKEDFLSMLSRHSEGDLSATQEHLIFTRNILRKQIYLHFQRVGLRNRGVLSFWQEFLENNDMKSLESDGYFFDSSTSALTKVQDGWSYIFIIPLSFFREARKIPRSDQSTVEDLTKMLMEIREAKNEFRELLEEILSTSGSKSTWSTRWIKKPSDYHLNLDWDVGFSLETNTKEKTLSIRYASWHPVDLNYGKDLLRIISPEKFTLCRVSGTLENRAIHYTSKNGWKLRFSLA